MKSQNAVVICPNVGKVAGCVQISFLVLNGDIYINPPIEFVGSVVNQSFDTAYAYCSSCQQKEKVV